MKVCDVFGCNNEATEIIKAKNGDETETVNLCSFHYQDWKSDKSIEKEFILKDELTQLLQQQPDYN